jgi:hypothetical protein
MPPDRCARLTPRVCLVIFDQRLLRLLVLIRITDGGRTVTLQSSRMRKWLQLVRVRRAAYQAIAITLVCLLCLAAAAQAAHLHRGSLAQYSNHHCSLCAEIHVAPVLAAGPVVTPAATTFAAVEVGDSIETDKLLPYSLSVRPPPAS